MPVKSKLGGLTVFAEDIFFEVSRVVDYFLRYAEEASQEKTEGLWVTLTNEIHDLNPNTDDNTKNLLAGTVFIFTREILAHHCESVYKDTINDMLAETLEKHLGYNYYEDEVYKGIIIRLIECSQLLDKWINNY